MKAEDIKLQELVEFRDGMVSLHGRRLVIHDMRAFAQFRNDLLQTVGVEQARRILTRFGLFWGRADAAAMRRIFEWKGVEELLKAGPRLHMLHGAVKPVIKRLVLDEVALHFEMDIVWHESAEAQEHLAQIGQSPSPVCWILTGYASGYASHCLGREVYFLEHKCVAKGDRVCAATGKDIATWGQEIKPHLAYFQAADIQAKVQELTRELRSRAQEIARQKRQLGLLAAPLETEGVEIHSENFRKTMELASRIAPYDTSVLITGETGVGKEVLARYIHRHSRRREGPLLAVNCGALPETLLESELFGHKAGAFTGAVADRIGLFEQASKGTIFLDEIGDVSAAMQAKLLRVLQEKEIRRVGESRNRIVDVRVIAATNRNLAQAVKDGRFREDLYYRLKVIEIEVPPLRQRVEDILPLTRHFVKRFAKRLKIPSLRLDATCLDYLQSYAWPGNVRELENALERAAVMGRDGVILPDCLPPSILKAVTSRSSGDPLARSLQQAEMDHILAVLDACGGRRKEAARRLGIGLATLWRKLKQRPS